MDADFGFAGMFWSPEANLAHTWFRAYDPALGRWLTRDPLTNAEIKAGPNLYAYAGSNPINRIDRLGLKDTSCCKSLIDYELDMHNEVSRCELDVFKAQIEQAMSCEIVYDEWTPETKMDPVAFYAEQAARALHDCQASIDHLALEKQTCEILKSMDRQADRESLQCFIDGCTPQKPDCKGK